jgi:predicted ATP-grasp superfamily ATP-dependent carboligase
MENERPSIGGGVPSRVTTPVLLLRLDDNIFHHGTLAAVRSLGRAGIPVHAILEGPHAPVSRSRYLTGMHTWPESPGTFAAALTAIGERIGGRPLLIPMDDAGAIAVAERAAELTPAFLLPRQSPALPGSVADKSVLARLCTSLNLAHPETVLIRDAADRDHALARLGLPLMAKWARPWLLPPGGRIRSTSRVGDAQTAARLCEQAAETGSDLLFQRLIPPSPGSDWFFHGYFGDDSSCLFGGTGRKERAYPAGAGLTTLGRWVPNARVEEIACEMAATLGYRGILDLDFRQDRRTGAYHLLDFNPRLGAQFRLFSDEHGLDVVRAMHLDLTGGEVPERRPCYGRTYLVENYDAFRAIRAPRWKEPGWFRGLHEADEFAWFAKDDLSPFLGMAGQTMRRAFTRATGLFSRRPR